MHSLKKTMAAVCCWGWVFVRSRCWPQRLRSCRFNLSAPRTRVSSRHPAIAGWLAGIGGGSRRFWGQQSGRDHRYAQGHSFLEASAVFPLEDG